MPISPTNKSSLLKACVNDVDPYTLDPVNPRMFFAIRGAVRGIRYALDPRCVETAIRKTGVAQCPYTRRTLSDIEVLRLDTLLRLPVLDSCWYIVATGERRRAVQAALLREAALSALRAALNDFLHDIAAEHPDHGDADEDAFPWTGSQIRQFEYLRHAMRHLSSRFGASSVRSILTALAAHYEAFPEPTPVGRPWRIRPTQVEVLRVFQRQAAGHRRVNSFFI